MKSDDPYVIMPWKNETLAEQKARFSEAIQEEYTLENVESGAMKAPGLNRKHVFDIGVGVRMIVSREDHLGQSLIHFSFGVPPWSAIHNPGLLFYTARDLVRYFIDQPLELESEAATPKCVHFWFKVPGSTPSAALTA